MEELGTAIIDKRGKMAKIVGGGCAVETLHV